MVEHTPGPWLAFIEGRTIAVHKGSVRKNPNAPAIVHWVGFDSSDVSLAKQKANARLIAAAPDLLAALEEMLAVGESDEPMVAQVAAVAKARTIVAKIRGGS